MPVTRFLILLLVCIFGTLAGCASVPPVPAQTNATSAVVHASATEPIGQATEGSSQVVPATGASAIPLPQSKPEGAKLEEKTGYELSDFSPEKIGKTIRKMAGYGPNEDIARSLLKEGETLFHQKKYDEAAGRFASAAQRWPDSALEENAMFLLAESYFFSDKYPKAQDAYDELLKKHDNSRHLDTTCKRLFSIGQYWEKLDESNPHWPTTPNMTDTTRPLFDTFGNAIKAYESVRLHDPIGPLADDSIMAAACAYFRKGRYEDAAYQFDVLRKEYSQSEHQAKAHVLGIQSKLKMYQGHLYDGTPLKEADEIADQALSQFRTELGTEQQRVAQTRNDILERRAERDWAMAQYYDKKKQYDSARQYYHAIVKEYPQTKIAQQVHARLEEIRNEPDVPPKRFLFR